MKDIRTLMTELRTHPDYVFGTVFTIRDFPAGKVPEEFDSSGAEDRLAELGNEIIAS